jgi:GBP family porin
MKKNLIALAVFSAFSGAALAQSNVTLYGVIDVGFSYSDPSASGVSSTRGINSGIQSGNRWGLRGSEAISPNLNAVFTIEGGFSLDTGTLGQASAACAGTAIPPIQPQNSTVCGGASQNRLFGRQAWGGLSGGFGTVVAGRVATFSSGTGSFDMYGPVDPFGTGFGDGAGLLFSSARALRVDNAVLYQSPTFGGFKFGAGHAFNASGAEVAGSGNNVDVTFTGASFAAGPFWGAITWDRIDIPGASDNQTNLQLGLTFDLKFVKLHAGYAKEDNQRVFNVVSITSGADADAWMAGVTVPLAGGALFGSYQRYDGDSVQLVTATGTPGAIDERDVKTWGIGYSYPLSRRTNLYATFARHDGDHTLNNSTTWDRKFWAVGMRHLF